MVITNFNELKEPCPQREPQYKEIEVGLGPEYTIRVLQYLPINGKANLISYIVNAAIDPSTGCFSPVRTNVYYTIGVMRSYCGMHFDDDIDVPEAYDFLESTGIFDKVLEAIPDEERTYLESLVDDTIADVAKYNTSLAGILSNINQDATQLDKSIQAILEKVQNKEGMELLAEIKNVDGTD